ARQRADGPAVAPLAGTGPARAGPAGGRAVVAAASAGVVLALTASASVAAGGVDVAANRGPAPMANLTAITNDDDVIETSPSVTVAADAEWSFSSVAADVSSEPPPPPPPPPV